VNHLNFGGHKHIPGERLIVSGAVNLVRRWVSSTSDRRGRRRRVCRVWSYRVSRPPRRRSRCRGSTSARCDCDSSARSPCSNRSHDCAALNTPPARRIIWLIGEFSVGQGRPAVLIPRLHDITGCQTGCQTGFTTGWMFVYTIQPVVKLVVNRFDNRVWLYRVYKHLTCCQTGLTTGCIV